MYNSCFSIHLFYFLDIKQCIFEFKRWKKYHLSHEYQDVFLFLFLRFFNLAKNFANPFCKPITFTTLYLLTMKVTVCVKTYIVLEGESKWCRKKFLKRKLFLTFYHIRFSYSRVSVLKLKMSIKRIEVFSTTNQGLSPIVVLYLYTRFFLLFDFANLCFVNWNSNKHIGGISIMPFTVKIKSVKMK